MHFLLFSLSLFPGGQLILASGVCLVVLKKNYFLCSPMTKKEFLKCICIDIFNIFLISSCERQIKTKPVSHNKRMTFEYNLVDLLCDEEHF